MSEVAVSLGDVDVHLVLRREGHAAVPANGRVGLAGHFRWHMAYHVLHDFGVGVHRRRAQETLCQETKIMLVTGFIDSKMLSLGNYYFFQ